MRKLILHFLLAQFVIHSQAQSYLKKIVSGTELGVSFNDSTRAEMINIRELDDRYIHFYASDYFYLDDGGELTGTPLIYDLQEKQVINYTYDVEGNFYHGFTYPQEISQFPVEDKPSFVYHKGKIYHIGRRTDSTILIVFDLENKTRKFLATEKNGYAFITSFEREGKLYFAFSGGNILLTEVSDDAITTVLNTEALKQPHYRPVSLFSVLVYHNNKLIINQVDQIRAFDFETLQLDTLLELSYMPDSNDNYGNFFTSMLYQVLVHDDDIYMVTKIGGFSEPTNEMLFFGYVGEAEIYKTDGTKSGTKKLFSFPIREPLDPNGYSYGSTSLFPGTAKLISQDGHVYWLGFNADTTQIQVSKVVDDDLLPIGELPIQFSDNIPFVNNNFITHQYDNSTNTAEIFGLYGADRNYDDTTRNELYLWTIKDEAVEFLMNKESLIDRMNYEYLASGLRLDAYVKFYPINKDSVLMIDSRYETIDPDLGTINGLKLFISLVDVSQQTITILDSLTDYYALDLSDSDAKDGDIFLSLNNSLTGANEIWEFNLNRISTQQNQVKYSEALFSLYPNPATETITIQSEELMRGQLIIAGIDGKIHKTAPFNGCQQQMDVSSLPNGMYIVMVKNGEKTGVKRLVIQR